MESTPGGPCISSCRVLFFCANIIIFIGLGNSGKKYAAYPSSIPNLLKTIIFNTLMEGFLSAVFGLICKGIFLLFIVSVIAMYASLFSGRLSDLRREMHCHKPSRPKKGGYREPSKPRPQRKRPEWVRFLFEETPATLWAKHKQRKQAEKMSRDSAPRRPR